MAPDPRNIHLSRKKASKAHTPEQGTVKTTRVTDPNVCTSSRPSNQKTELDEGDSSVQPKEATLEKNILEGKLFFLLHPLSLCIHVSKMREQDMVTLLFCFPSKWLH